MPVKKDPSGKRSIELSFDLPGTPEQVWQAIATGPGISSWFVPSEVEEKVGGKVAFHLGEDMDSSGQVTAWEPPRLFAYEEVDWNGDAPPLASEFHIETQTGGLCTVRVVHSLFTSDDDWDDQLESMETGWPGFFNILRLYLTHFAGMPAASGGSMSTYKGGEADAWAALTTSLGLAGAPIGEERELQVGQHSYAGIIERVEGVANHHELTMRLARPAPGIVLFSTFSWGGETQIAISLFFYGEHAEDTTAEEEQRWSSWVKQHFAMDQDIGD